MSGNTPGQAAFGTFDDHMVKTTPAWSDARMTHDEAWASFTSEERQAWEAAAQAAIAAYIEVNGRDPVDARAIIAEAVAPELAAAMAETRKVRAERDDPAERLGVLLDRIDSLSRGLAMSARATAPSKKSEIEAGVAAALLGLLRIDGESVEQTRGRLDGERDEARSDLGRLRELIGEILARCAVATREVVFLATRGEYDAWRQRAGLDVTTPAQAVSKGTRQPSSRCPECDARSQGEHPAIGGGGEVTHICGHPFHGTEAELAALAQRTGLRVKAVTKLSRTVSREEAEAKAAQLGVTVEEFIADPFKAQFGVTVDEMFKAAT